MREEILWKKDSFGMPCHSYTVPTADGKKKREIYSVKSYEGSSFPLLEVLRIVRDAEAVHGEIRNIHVCLNYTNSYGSGQDRENGYYDFWITFERQETSVERAKRLELEKKELEKKVKAERDREIEERNLLATLTKKYDGKPDVRKS
jgi:hypothetical protein